MDERYSTYEAKARFSELMRKVREGKSVTITYHGEPVAELRPLAEAGTVAARIERLTSRGVVSPRKAARPQVRPMAVRPGALQRFLEERAEG
ncbi:MAG: type II toxin-antitoxin system Phd/YefM family antitoxin [Longimicrobiales bacterium]